MSSEKGKKIEINLPSEKAGGDYSNLAVVTHSLTEFIMDFCQMMPGTPKASVVSRLVMNPMHAKALMRTLQMNIERYEQSFGEIRDIGQAPVGVMELGESAPKKMPN